MGAVMQCPSVEDGIDRAHETYERNGTVAVACFYAKRPASSRRRPSVRLPPGH
jgi:hypothetical protein